MSTIKVQNIQHTASNTNAIALASDGTCTANITNNLSNRNLIINGAMQVAARGTSGSTTEGYPSIDRFYTFSNGLDENPTMSQESLTSSDTPFSSGFRKYLRFKNGNQTSGAGASDQTFFRQGIEAQNVAQSGWNYTSSSSFLTLSFWIRASVAQTYYGFLKAPDGSNYLYPFSMALSANTWTKVTKSIPGNSNLVFDNDNGLGLEVGIYAYLGTTFTDNSVSLDTWAAYSSGTTRTPDHTTTWYTTNDSTIDMTGVQLEVDHTGSGKPTDFEHRSFAQELALCQRYYFIYADGSGGVNQYQITNIHGYSTGQLETTIDYSCANLRAIPSLVQGSGTNYYNAVNATAAINFNSFTAIYQPSTRKGLLYTNSTSGTSPVTGTAYRCQFANNGAYIHLDAEL
tara:strand:- start:323 stop:1522 length:1200 start_codon:yes stop_codon:yes gene_type:complete